MKKWLLMLVCALSFSAQAAHIEVTASDTDIAVGESTTISVLASFTEEALLGSLYGVMDIYPDALTLDESSVASTLSDEGEDAFEFYVLDGLLNFSFFSGEGLSGAFTLITFDVEANEAGVYDFGFLDSFFGDLDYMDIEFDESSVFNTTLNVTAVDAPAPLTAGLMLMAGLMFVARRRA